MYSNDSALINACLNNDQAAWKELVRRYSRLVYSIAVRNGLSSTDADDVFQNVFTIVFRRLNTLRDQKLIAAWLIRITYHECQHVRKASPQTTDIDESIPDSHDLSLDQIHIWERRQIVHQALTQLQSPCREMLEMLFLSTPPPSYEEIADLLCIPIGSVGPIRARCLKKLETILKEMGFEFEL